MISYRTWQQQYGSDPSVVGSTFILNGNTPFTIIGIAPPGFFGETLRANPPDLWIPINQEPLFQGSNSITAPLPTEGMGQRVIGPRQARRFRGPPRPAPDDAPLATGSSLAPAAACPLTG